MLPNLLDIYKQKSPQFKPGALTGNVQDNMRKHHKPPPYQVTDHSILLI